ncbi:MAG TPA: inositol-3-phosphate synthase, partial [Hymenobacter sp.]
MKQQPGQVAPAEGKLGILMPGLGAVATTVIAGVLAVRKGGAQPIGSLTQMGNIRIGKRTANNYPKIKDFVPLTDLNDIEFGGWDVYEDNVYQAALNANVLEPRLLESIRPELEALKPMTAAFDRHYVKNLDGTHVKTYTTKHDLAEQVIEDIRNFKATRNCSRLVMVWCGSTEIYHEPSEVHRTLAGFEEGLRNNAPNIAPSMIYAYAALKEGVPFVNGAPNLTVDVPALLELAQLTGTPVAGKDFKTGQT